MDALNALLPAELPLAAKLFVAAMAVLNLSAVVAWAVCVCREARAPPAPKVRVRRDE